jgi:hypothetical protein
MTKIHLHIEHLSLPGYTPAERRAFVAALEQELAKRAGAADFQPTIARSVGNLQIKTSNTTPAMQAQAIGRALIAAPAGQQNARSTLRAPVTIKSR